MHIVIPDDYQDAVRGLDCFSMLKGHKVTVHHDSARDPDILAGRFEHADALVLIRERTPIDDELLARLPSLKAISQTGGGVAHIDLQACTRRGVAVMAGGTSTDATAELTWGLILAGMRRIPLEARHLREGRWQTTLGYGLKGRNLGIAGYGKIGRAVARVGLAFGMRVQVWGQAGSAARAREDDIPFISDKSELLSAADVLALHVRLKPETRGLFTEADLDLMKPTALLVNTSRAGLIAPGALYNALGRGRPGFAAVDVFEEEPVLGGNHPLLAMDNVVCTPHLGYVEKDSYEHFFSTAFDQLLAFADGQPKNLLNPDALRQA